MLDSLSFALGLCGGMVIMGYIASKMKWGRVTRVAEMESQVEELKRELSVQRNVVKTLSENNQRLLKSNKQLKKAKLPNDDTIARMLFLHGQWAENKDCGVSPSEFIKIHW